MAKKSQKSPHKPPQKSTAKAASFIVKLPFYLLITWGMGFILFFTSLPIPPTQKLNADAIVVLTGGSGRLETGLTLLKEQAAPKLLISGVNPDVEIAELTALTGAEAKLFECCIDLDRTASNTQGNARETAAWAKGNGYKSILLVTADYHIQRARVLFRTVMPDIEILAVPVKTNVSAAYLIKEYNKYLFTLIRQAIG